jgi:hypothetical protein
MAVPLQSENPFISTSCEGSAADASIALAAVNSASELRPSSALWNPSEPPALARPIGLRYRTVRTYTSFLQLSTVTDKRCGPDVPFARGSQDPLSQAARRRSLLSEAATN